jgi:serine/threonine protein kinase
MSLKLVLQIGINILTILMKMHDIGFIHRDIKPENFLLTLNKPTKVVLIDFGLCKPYLVNNKHIEFKCKNKFIGTLNFASINTHNLYEQSRRDDLECVAYILIYFYFGKLDWINEEYQDTFELENNYVKSIKQLLINNKNIPNILLDFYTKIRRLDFEERPTYEKYIDSFREELTKL